MNFHLKVEIPPYCEIPYNKIRCPFLNKTGFGRKSICMVYNVKVKKAAFPWTNITLPCKECEKDRTFEWEGNDNPNSAAQP